jgi:hypothetical protein
MAHFAKIENGIVTQVIVVSNDKAPGEFPESEAPGVAFCQSLFGGEWKQTSYNSNFRVRYAGIGFSYNEEHDAFIAPKPYPSWILNLETLDWEAPIPYPEDGKVYVWNEDILNWEEIEIEE